MLAHALHTTRSSLAGRQRVSFLTRRLHTHTFLFAAIACAFGLRLATATGSLWLDEIWSLEIAQQTSSLRALATEVHSDNHHFLNTLYLRALGPGWPAVAYRFLSIVCGCLTVGVGYRIARYFGQTTAIYATTCLATSYLLIHYSSEARGYAPALLLGLLATLATLRWLENPGWAWVTIFWASCLMGLLCHPLFIHTLLAIGCWGVTVVRKSSQQPHQAWRALVMYFSLPFAFASVLYWSNWRHFELGGGPDYSWTDVLLQTGSLAIGGPPNGAVGILAATLMIACAAYSCWSLRNHRLHAGLLLMLMLLVPFALTWALRPPFLFPRYFLAAIVWVPLAVGIVLGQLHRHGPTGRWLASALLIVFIASNLAMTVPLVRIGRGQYQAALEHMLRTTDSPRVLVTSDHDFGSRKLIHFYSPLIRDGERIEYCNGQRLGRESPDWLILHRTAEDPRPLPESTLEIDGLQFELDRSFGSSILSGWQWWCYRRLAQPVH